MALSPHTRVELKTLYNALADRVLEPHDPVYVEELNAKAGFGGDPVAPPHRVDGAGREATDRKSVV